MATKPITNDTEQRSATVLLNHHSLAMCNDMTMDKLVEDFAQAKDLLIEIYKYNAQRIVESEERNNAHN